MERYNQDNYYHSGLGEQNKRKQSHGSNYNNDFGRGYDRREDNFNGRSIEERRMDMSQYDNHADLRSGNHDFDNQAFREYQRHDRELKDAYAGNVRRERHQLNDIRQGYGFSDFENSSDAGRQQQQGYNSGRMGGYSGAAFGGSNYSSHGGFGGAPEYGAMSGDRGNVNDYISSSGYGGGERSDFHADSDFSKYGKRDSYDGTAYGSGTSHNSFGQNRNENRSGKFGEARENRYRRNNEQSW